MELKGLKFLSTSGSTNSCTETILESRRFTCKFSCVIFTKLTVLWGYGLLLSPSTKRKDKTLQHTLLVRGRIEQNRTECLISVGGDLQKSSTPTA